MVEETRKEWERRRTVEEGIIEECMEKYGTEYPHITREDYKSFVRGSVDNYFPEEGMRIWLDETVPHLTPERLVEVRQDHNFMFKEGHGEHIGYTPLAERVQTAGVGVEVNDTIDRVEE